MDDAKIQKLVRVKGQRGTEIFLETLARNKQFRNAIETPIGVELLMDTVHMLKNDIETVLNGKDDIDVRARIKVYRSLLEKWSEKLNLAESGQYEFTKITEGE